MKAIAGEQFANWIDEAAMVGLGKLTRTTVSFEKKAL